jgi:hypothetical protein
VETIGGAWTWHIDIWHVDTWQSIGGTYQQLSKNKKRNTRLVIAQTAQYDEEIDAFEHRFSCALVQGTAKQFDLERRHARDNFHFKIAVIIGDLDVE